MKKKALQLFTPEYLEQCKAMTPDQILTFLEEFRVLMGNTTTAPQTDKLITSEHWRRIGTKHHQGIAVSLMSLHSEKSSGMARFCDLIPLADWCKEVGFSIIQLLPLNDSGNGASPYNAISSHALHPIYLSLEDLPHNRDPLPFIPQAKRLDYQKTLQVKEAFLNQYLDKHQEKLASSPEFKKWLKENGWVVGYALFKTLQEKYHYSHWKEWPEDLRDASSKALDAAIEEHEYEIERHCVIQYLCSQQLNDVYKALTKKGVLLMGDIPILLSPNSADVWLHQGYFDMSLGAGAPPDMYSKEGQSWGFPLYRWEALEKDNFAWWRERLQAAEHYYHIYRIDHVVGFFRIWAVPKDASGKDGFFIPKNEKEWIPQGEKLLKMMLKSTEMLPIGEDLGTIPPEVRTWMRDNGISGTKVMRWEKEWNKKETPFIDPKSYPQFSLTTISTHDSEPLEQWWINAPKEAEQLCTERGWKYQKQLTPDLRKVVLADSHRSNSFFHINFLQEYLALFPDLVWGKPEEERINVPGTIDRTNWTYRTRPSIEYICRHVALKDAVKGILEKKA